MPVLMILSRLQKEAQRRPTNLNHVIVRKVFTELIPFAARVVAFLGSVNKYTAILTDCANIQELRK